MRYDLSDGLISLDGSTAEKMADLSDCSDRERTRHHESGHATFATSLGLEVSLVEAVRSGAKNGRTLIHGLEQRPAYVTGAVYLAGRAAEKAMGSRLPGIGVAFLEEREVLGDEGDLASALRAYGTMRKGVRPETHLRFLERAADLIAKEFFGLAAVRTAVAGLADEMRRNFGAPHLKVATHCAGALKHADDADLVAWRAAYVAHGKTPPATRSVSLPTIQGSSKSERLNEAAAHMTAAHDDDGMKVSHRPRLRVARAFTKSVADSLTSSPPGEQHAQQLAEADAHLTRVRADATVPSEPRGRLDSASKCLKEVSEEIIQEINQGK